MVATPGRLAEHLEKKSISLSDTLQMLVIDEADLIMGYGYADDMKKIASRLPQVCQSFLMSATLTPEVQSLKKLVLHNPAVLKLEETEDEARRLAQYYMCCSAKDKFLVLYGVLRLKHIMGKVLIFVQSVDMCYKVKMFLEQFSIKAAVLNAELPQNSRLREYKDSFA